LGWSDSKGILATDLYERGAVEFGSFPLNNPELSPSPIYFNLRMPDSPKNPGKLTADDIEKIAAELFCAVQASDMTYDLVAGIPHAGEPLARAFIKRTLGVYRATFEKTESGKICCYDLGDDYRLVARREGPSEKWPQVLLIDDVLSSGDSALEAITAVMDKSYARYVKHQFVALIDREQGGREILEKCGFKVITCCSISQFLAFGLHTGRISLDQFEEVMDYTVRTKQILLGMNQ